MRRRTPPLLLSLAMVAGLLPSAAVTAQEADPPGASEVMITAFRVDGPSGGNDEYVQLTNTGDDDVDISGWRLQGCAGTSGNSGNRATVPGDIALAPSQSYLFTNSGNNGYSGAVVGDQTYATGIANASQGGVRVVDGAGDPVDGADRGDTACSQAGVGIDTYPSSAPFDLVREGDGFINTEHTPDNLQGDGGDGVPDPSDDVTIDCTAPFTIVEGFASAAAEADSQATDKAITCTADGGSGDYAFDVTEVSPEPATGAVEVTAVEGSDVEVRFSDDVPGLDPSVDGPRLYDVTVTVTDAQDDELTASATTSTRLVPNLRIGTLRGPVADDADGRQHVSPYALGTPPFQGHPNAVGVTGVVTQLTLEENAGGNFDFQGFFLQSLDADPSTIDGIDAGDPALADGDARTSDGLFVSMGTFPTLRLDEPGTTPPAQQYRPEPGDILTIRGSVIESFDQTQIDSPFLVDVRRAQDTGVEVPRDIEVVELTPPDDEREASVHFERRAGMQATVREGSVVISGNDLFAPSTSEFWLVDRDHPVAQRDDVDARRIFRPYHPLANPFDAASFEERIDRTGARLHLGSFGVKATSGDATELIAPAISGQALGEDATGGLFYSFSKYTVMPEAQPVLVGDADPAASSLQVLDGFAPDDEYSVMVYNVENLYDFRSDPFSGCDLDTDVVPAGQQPTANCPADEPGGSTVSGSFDYAPRTQQDYDEQRGDIAEQILTTLRAPDIITIQEAEKQDVCTPVFDEVDPQASTLTCDLSAPEEGETASDNARGSGALDVLDELAVEIFKLSDGEVRYQASGDGDNGRDVRGISQGFLHRVDRVELVPVEELTDDPVLGAGDAVDLPYPSADERTPLAPWVLEAANPKAINAELPDDVAVQDGGRFPQTGYVFTRPAQVAKFRIFPDGVDGAAEPVERYVTSNHMSAGPDGRVEQRTEQARLNAAVGEAAVEAGGRALITGDFNVFPRPDDPFPAYATDPDREPSDQLAALYERGFANLHDTIIEEAPANTYSFIFQGISQILDHVFVDEATLEELVTARYIHVNTDFPADGQSTRPGRGASDHDPLYARFAFEVVEDDGPSPDRPQTREDCLDGGWRGFDDPSYRNQGRCVADVSSGGRAGGPGDAAPGPSTPQGRAR